MGPELLIGGAVLAFLWWRNRGKATTGGTLPGNSGDQPGEQQPDPHAQPPAGGLTAQERKLADQAVAASPTSIDPSIVPAPTNSKGDRTWRSWLTSYVYWRVYRDPNEVWRKSGGVLGPVATDPGSAWAAAWNRINEYLGTKQLPADVQPNPNPNPNPNPPNPEPVNVPVGPITANEKSSADAGVFLLPKEIVSASIPANLAKKGDRTWLNWLTTWTYWTVYVVPGGYWVTAGNPAGPVTIPADSPFAARWNAIRTYLQTKSLPGDGQIEGNKLPQGPVTEDEKKVADLANLLRPIKIDPAIVPPPTNEKGDKTWLPWLTSFTYWSIYVAPTGTWVKAGNAPGPVTLNAQSPFAARWNAINAHLKAQGVT